MNITSCVPLNLDIDKLLSVCDTVTVNETTIAEYKQSVIEQKKKGKSLVCVSLCGSTADRKYYAEHRDELRARYRARYKANHDKMREQMRVRSKRFYELHRDEVKARVAAYRAEHRDEINAKKRAARAEKKRYQQPGSISCTTVATSQQQSTE